MRNVYIKNIIPHLATYSSVKYPRIALSAIEECYTKWLGSPNKSNNFLSDDYVSHCLGITGLRRVGKTTLLKQLYNKLGNACYIDCTLISEKDSILDILDYVEDKGVKICLLDEICKLKSDNRMGIDVFISNVKSTYDNIYFVFTGSASNSVKRIINGILDCDEYNLPPIAYAEKLWWNNGCPVLKELYNLTTYDYFKKMLNINFDDNKRVDYIRRIVDDAWKSHQSREYSYSDKEYSVLLNDNLSDETLKDMLRYIELCQVLMFVTIKNTRVNQPQILSIVDESIKAIRDTLSAKIFKLQETIKPAELKLLCQLLETSGLAIRETEYKSSDIRDIVKNYNVECYRLLLPQIVYRTYDKLCKDLGMDKLISLVGSVDLANNIDLTNSIETSFTSYWVENILAVYCSLLYASGGKYRHKEQYEIDVVYKLINEDVESKNYYLMEVKDRPWKKARDYAYPTSKYDKKFKDSVGEYIITCKDVTFNKIDVETCCDNSYTMRNDIVLITLELEYLMNQCNYGIKCGTSIVDLYRKYKDCNVNPNTLNPSNSTTNGNNVADLYDKCSNDTNYFC